LNNAASKLPLLLALPGVAFWIVMVFWWNDHRPGEHYDYLVTEWLLAFVNAACFVIASMGGLVAWRRDWEAKSWWIAVVVSLPAVCVLVWILMSPYTR
jgi:uncharacterized membrane protein HdeD (DUF308 family)